MHLYDSREEGIHIVEQCYRIQIGSDIAFLDLVTIGREFSERTLQVLFHYLHLCIDIEIAVDKGRSNKSVGSILIACHAVVIGLSDPYVRIVGLHSSSCLVRLFGLRYLSELHLQISQLHTIAHIIGIAGDELAVFVKTLFGAFLVAENGKLIACELFVDTFYLLKFIEHIKTLVHAIQTQIDLRHVVEWFTLVRIITHQSFIAQTGILNAVECKEKVSLGFCVPIVDRVDGDGLFDGQYRTHGIVLLAILVAKEKIGSSQTRHLLGGRVLDALLRLLGFFGRQFDREFIALRRHH